MLQLMSLIVMTRVTMIARRMNLSMVPYGRTGTDYGVTHSMRGLKLWNGGGLVLEWVFQFKIKPPGGLNFGDDGTEPVPIQ